MNSNKRTARIVGVLYLLVGIFGSFAEGFVEQNASIGILPSIGVCAEF
jgi:hypothetical protein